MATETPAGTPAAAVPPPRWRRQPEADRYVRGLVDDFVRRTSYAAELSRRMLADTGTQFYDWVESLTLAPQMQPQVEAAGFTPIDSDIIGVYGHRGGRFPLIVLDLPHHFDVTLRVECVADFAAARGLPLLTADEPLAPYRRTLVARGNGTELWAAERHGFRGFLHPRIDAEQRTRMIYHLEHFRTRRRSFTHDVDGFRHAGHLIDAAVRDLGVNLTCDLFFFAEREFWQRRTGAGQVQKLRQDAMGLGWGNHDHHTYRSSRELFIRLTAILEKLGFVTGDRLFAGSEAGWGMQVLEQPDAEITVCAEVDLAQDEMAFDFSHEGLATMPKRGPIGRWCATHGESFLDAGMQRLNCRVDFAAARKQLSATAGLTILAPTVDLPYIKIACSAPTPRSVVAARLDRLTQAADLSAAQVEGIRQHGADGSQLGLIERGEGYGGMGMGEGGGGDSQAQLASASTPV